MSDYHEPSLKHTRHTSGGDDNYIELSSGLGVGPNSSSTSSSHPNFSSSSTSGDILSLPTNYAKIRRNSNTGLSSSIIHTEKPPSQIPPSTPFQIFKPYRTSSLHHVTSFLTPTDMSPISPSAMAPSPNDVTPLHIQASSSDLLSSNTLFGSMTGVSTYNNGPFSKMLHPSSATSSRRNSRTAFTNSTPTSSNSTAATLYFGPSSSVSSLGLESGFLLKRNKKNKKKSSGISGIGNDHKYHSSSSSSSDDDDLIAAGYDSDDRMSLTSRRPSVSSLKGSDLDNTTTSPAPTAIVRQMISNGRSLKPKMKSFLRISKDLQEEMSPLDFEIRREAEVTSTFRDEEKAIKPSSSIINPQISPSEFTSNSNPTIPTTSDPDFSSSFRHQELIARLEKFAPPLNKELCGSAIISDTDDSDAAPLSVTPSLKRKVTFLQDSPVGNLKRRAVSPGLSSPIIGSPTTHVSRRASVKQVYDTSDGFQNLNLM